MLSRCLQLVSIAFLGLGLLTVLPAPSWVDWRLTILAGSYGHWLGIGAIVIVIWAWKIRMLSRRGAMLAVACGIGGTVLLTKPSIEAGQLGRALPTVLADRFGAVHEPPRAAFSLRGFLQRSAPRVPVASFEYAPDLGLNFYRADRREPAPCVIVVHGGGWDNGYRSQLPDLNYLLAARGYAVAAISYRLAPAARWPAQREDLVAALSFLKTRAAELGIDPQRFVLLGRSAGGQIAEATACTINDPAIRGVIALYAPADLEFAYSVGAEDDILASPRLIRQLLGGSPAEQPEAMRSASAYFQVSSATPPTLLLHGQLDTLVWHKQSERLTTKLEAAGVKHAFVSLPWASHAFDYSLRSPAGQITTYAIEWFLASVTEP